MSVPAYKRRMSSIEYISQAQELLRITIKNCEKIPKRYTFFGVQHAYNIAQQILDNCICANNFNLSTFYEQRALCLQNALNSLACLSNHLQTLMIYADELDDKKWLIWGKQITICEKLIKGVMKSDKERLI